MQGNSILVYLVGIDDTTFKAVLQMICTSANVVKKFNKLEADCIQGEMIMAQSLMPDPQCPLEALAQSSTITQNILQTMTQMSTQEAKIFKSVQENST